jgi:hypothetical protein
MYPINLRNAAAGGYAVANSGAEHKALSDAGYEPKFVAVSEDDEIAAARAKLDAAGIAYDKRLGLAKLQALLPA